MTMDRLFRNTKFLNIHTQQLFHNYAHRYTSFGTGGLQFCVMLVCLCVSESSSNKSKYSQLRHVTHNAGLMLVARPVQHNG